MYTLRSKFNADMENLYYLAKRECHYSARRYIRMIHERGGLETAKHLLHSKKPGKGLEILRDCRRLDLSVEALVLKPEYRSLFTPEELHVASERLKMYEESKGNNGKVNAIKNLNIIRKSLIKSKFEDLADIIVLLTEAKSISQKAPLRTMIKYDGSTFTNYEERQLLLSILDREINELQKISKASYKYYRFQITTTIVMLMVSISDYGITELEKIIYQ